jgi:hypothetical protein
VALPIFKNRLTNPPSRRRAAADRNVRQNMKHPLLFAFLCCVALSVAVAAPSASPPSKVEAKTTVASGTGRVVACGKAGLRRPDGTWEKLIGVYVEGIRPDAIKGKDGSTSRSVGNLLCYSRYGRRAGKPTRGGGKLRDCALHTPEPIKTAHAAVVLTSGEPFAFRPNARAESTPGSSGRSAPNNHPLSPIRCLRPELFTKSPPDRQHPCG